MLYALPQLRKEDGTALGNLPVTKAAAKKLQPCLSSSWYRQEKEMMERQVPLLQGKLQRTKSSALTQCPGPCLKLVLYLPGFPWEPLTCELYNESLVRTFYLDGDTWLYAEGQRQAH